MSACTKGLSDAGAGVAIFIDGGHESYKRFADPGRLEGDEAFCGEVRTEVEAVGHADGRWRGHSVDLGPAGFGRRL